MKRITVTQVLTIASGVIAISEDQYKRRSHNLSLIGEDSADALTLNEDDIDMLHEAECAPCRIVKPVQFKVGEVLFLAELPKAMNPSFKTDADLEDEAAAADEAAEKVEAAQIAAEEAEAEAKRLAAEAGDDGKGAGAGDADTGKAGDADKGKAGGGQKKAPKKKAPNKKSK